MPFGLQPPRFRAFRLTLFTGVFLPIYLRRTKVTPERTSPSALANYAQKGRWKFTQQTNFRILLLANSVGFTNLGFSTELLAFDQGLLVSYFPLPQPGC